ncbi:MAG: hypothetical protein KJ574_01330, partial [Nanoarchaeota archaeon]|nr:hypothetical protein [Nanoarchaeota archaeon]
LLIIPLVLTIILSIAHYYFEVYAHHLRKFDTHFISLSSGLFITYIFLSMFPEMMNGINYLADNIYFIALWGFVLFHIFEKQVSQSAKTHYEEEKRLVTVRTSAFFINLFIVGMSFIFFFKLGNKTLGYFSFIPLLFHVISSSLVVEHLHHRVRESVYGRLLSSGSIFIGALVAALISFPVAVYYAAFAFITGMLLYIITRDVMPKYRTGKPSYFIIGIILYLAIIIIERIIF